MKPEPIPSKAAWELEYENPQLLTRADEPTKEFRDFVSWLRKEEGFHIEGKRVLDLGCGTGRNLLYLAERAHLTGIGVDISHNALRIAKERSRAYEGVIEWVQHDLTTLSSLGDFGTFDVIIDSTTSHLFPREPREKLAKHCAAVLNPGGYLYMRTLTADGDRNAHNLMKEMPGPEPKSYVHPSLGVVEYMLTQKELEALYEPDLIIRHARKYTGYQKWGAQSYKRRYVTLYLQKPHE